MSVTLISSVLASALLTPVVSARNWVDLQVQRAAEAATEEASNPPSEQPAPAGPSTGVVPQVTEAPPRCPQRPTVCPANRLLAAVATMHLLPPVRLESNHPVYIVDLVPVPPRRLAPACWPQAPPRD